MLNSTYGMIESHEPQSVCQVDKNDGPALTHYGLVMPYGDILVDLAQDWLR